jgi:Condensation domain
MVPLHRCRQEVRRMEVVSWQLEFIADGRSGPLSWAQRAAWDRMLRQKLDPSALALGEVMPVETASIPEVLGAVVRLVERHEALRSRYRLHATGAPFQEALACGSLTVTSEEVSGSDANVAEAAIAAMRRITETARDLGNDWLSHFHLITRAHMPAYLVVVVCRLSVDAWGLQMVVNELTALLAGEGLDRDNSAYDGGWHPLDQAEYEASAQGQRQNERSLAYWERSLRSCPQSMFWLAHGCPDEPRFWGAQILSPALAAAEQFLEERYSVQLQNVVLAAVVALLGLYTGSVKCVMEVITSNRWQGRLHTAVCDVIQKGLFVVETDSETFRDVMASTTQALFKTYRYGQYDPAHLNSIVSSVENERGVHIDRSCFFNNRRVIPPGELQSDQYLVCPDESRRNTEFTWLTPSPSCDTKFYLSLDDSTWATGLTIYADALYMPPDDIRAFLYSIETLILAAVRCEVKISEISGLTGLHAPHLSDVSSEAVVDNCRIRPASVARLVRLCCGGTQAQVQVFPLSGSDVGRGLIACIATSDPTLNPDQLHRRCLVALEGNQDAITPALYRISHTAPEFPSELSEWLAQPAVHYGTGRNGNTELP